MDDHVLRITDLDRHIQEALRREPPVPDEHEVIRYAPPAARTQLPPLPPYVEHRDDLDVIGKAAATAIVMQYEGATKALETMGKELIQCVQQAQSMSENCIAMIKYVAETCDLYREDSKAIFARIEQASALTFEVRKVCEEMRSKISEKSQRSDNGHSNSGQDETASDQQARVPDAMVRGHA
jgi:hypothetical protein